MESRYIDRVVEQTASKIKQDISCKIIRTMIAYLRKHRGEAAVDAMVRDCGLPLEHLMNENNWVSFDVYTQLCGFMKTTFHDPNVMYRVGLFTFSNADNFGTLGKLALSLLNPHNLYGRVPSVANQAVRFGKYEIVELGGNRCLLQFRNLPAYPFYKHNCNYRLGLFAGIPQLFALPIAHHRELECVEWGHDRCLYEFTWSPSMLQWFGPFTRWIALAGLFALVGVPLAWVWTGTPVSAVHWIALIAAIVAAYAIGLVVDIVDRNKRSLQGRSTDIEETVTYANEKYREATDTLIRLEAVIEANAALNAKLVRHELIDIVLDIIKNRLGYTRAMILFYDESAHRFTGPQTIGMDGPVPPPPSLYSANDPHHLHARVFKSGVPLLITDVSEFPDMMEAGTHSFAIIPFRIGVVVTGTLSVDAASGKPLTSDDIKILSTLCDMMSVALENADLYQDLEKRVAQRTAELHETNAKLAETLRTLQETQTQLLHTEKMASIGKLVAGVAHEINNPAGIVKGNLDFLEMHMAKIENLVGKAENGPLSRAVADLKECVLPARAALSRIISVVQDLRNFSRVDEAEYKMADINDGIRHVVRFFSAHTADRIELRCDLQPLPPLYCFPAHLNQAVSNLVQNAIDAIDGEGTIVIHTRREQSHGTDDIVVEVEDSGGGIPDEIVDRVFDPFFTTKDVGEGRGLGLSIAYGIVKRHGGRIDIVRHDSTGTVIQLRVPLSGNA